MCLIYYRDPATHSAPIDREILERGNKRNPDGAGLLFWDGAKWQRQRRAQLSDRELGNWIDYCSDRGYRFAIHFRLSTGGDKSKNNCHPFDLGSGYYLLHNGTLTIRPDQTRSDTNILATTIRRAKLADRIDAIAPLIDGVRNGSRLLIAQPDGISQFWGEWHDKPEGKYSNLNCHWAPAPPQRIGYVAQYDQREIAPIGSYPKAPDTWRYVNAIAGWVTPLDEVYRWNSRCFAYVKVPNMEYTYPGPIGGTPKPIYVPASSLGQGARAEDTEDLADDLRELLDVDSPATRGFKRRWKWN